MFCGKEQLRCGCLANVSEKVFLFKEKNKLSINRLQGRAPRGQQISVRLRGQNCQNLLLKYRQHIAALDTRDIKVKNPASSGSKSEITECFKIS